MRWSVECEHTQTHTLLDAAHSFEFVRLSTQNTHTHTHSVTLSVFLALSRSLSLSLALSCSLSLFCLALSRSPSLSRALPLVHTFTHNTLNTRNTQFLHLKMRRFAEAEELLRLAIVAGKAWEGFFQADDQVEETVTVTETAEEFPRGFGAGRVERRVCLRVRV